MLVELACGFWLALGVYVFWYLVKAKDFQPLTLDDLALTWRLHKHQSGCKASCVHDLLTRNDQVVGFKCDCGYKFLQKRLISQRVHVFAHTSLLQTPQAGELLSERNDVAHDLGLHYMNIRSV
jgi:hypothetical protein